MTKQISTLEALKPSESSLMSLVSQYKDKMIRRASDSIRKASPDKQEQFLARTVASIIKNDKLRECFNSSQGKVSIYMLIDDCLKTGLELDKHCYGIPYNKKVNNVWVKTASMQIKRQGFHALLCGGLKPIFKDLKWGMVYEKEIDDIKIDRASGEIVHPVNISEDRGKPVGCWVQAIKIDGTKEAEFYPIKYIHDIRNNHSKTYQDHINKVKDAYGKIKSSTWITDPIPMIEKTAIKSFCRPFADVCEELANAYYSEGDVINDKKSNIIDVADGLLDDAIEALDTEKEIKKDVIEEEVVEENKTDNKKVLF